MTTYTPGDTEFATATGANINPVSGYSLFDVPPASSTDLTITGAADDTTPYVFEIGETYKISWVSDGVPMSMEASVVRSDPLSVDTPVVVFEGVTDTGEPVQMIWAPGYDIDSWHAATLAAGNRPVFGTTDMQAEEFRFVCFTAGTRIDTPAGQVPVESLRAGAVLRARDGGRVRVRWMGARQVPGTGASAPVLFAPGAIGNDQALRLSQQHRVLVASPLAELHFGAPEVLVPAGALTGLRGVRLAPVAGVQYLHILLARHDILSAEGAGCESLYMGDVARGRLGQAAAVEAMRAAGLPADRVAAMRPARPVLTMREGRGLAAALAAQGPGGRAGAAALADAG